MKLAKLTLAALLAGSIFATTASADPAVGFKVFKKTIKKKTHLNGTKFLAKLGFTSPSQVEELKALFKNNGKPFLKLVEEKLGKKAASQVKKIIKKHKIKDLEDFLVGILTKTYVPAGCS